MPTFKEPWDTYRAREALTSHRLALFRRSPRLYQWALDGRIEDIDRAAYIEGRAAHCLILEGREEFDARYAVGGPVNPRTGRCYGGDTKAFQEWAQAQGKECISEDYYANLEMMRQSVQDHNEARQLLAIGEAEQTVIARYHDWTCQTRIDWLAPTAIVDLKTCQDIDTLEKDAVRYGYINQLAFYQSVCLEAGHRVDNCYIIGIEKQAPYRCGVWAISESALIRAAEQNEEAMDNLKRCSLEGDWPTGYEFLRVLEGQ
jgi:hypothetical protein